MKVSIAIGSTATGVSTALLQAMRQIVNIDIVMVLPGQVVLEALCLSGLEPA